MYLSLIPLLPFTVAFIAGILLQGSGMSDFFILLPVVAALILVLLRRNYPAIICIAIASGYFVSAIHSPSPLPESLRDNMFRYSGVVMEVRRLEPTQICVVRVDSCDGKTIRPFLTKISIPSSIPTVGERWRVRFSTVLNTPEYDPDLPDEIDNEHNARLLGVIGKGMVVPDSLTTVCPEPGLLNSLRRQREKLTLLIANSPLSSGTQAFINATLTGDRSMIETDTRELFASTGLSHILALSGLHVGIIVLTLYLLLFPLRLLGMNSLLNAMIIIAIVAFAIMTGLSPSVVRAVIMASVFILALSLQRVRSPLNSLCLAALLILLFSPRSIYTIGFQLSFLAVGSILIFAEKINPFDYRHPYMRRLATYPAVTIAALLGTGVVSACYFHIFPLYSVPANFISAMLLPFIIGGGIILLIANAVGLQWLWLAKTVDSLYDFMISAADVIGSLPGGTVKDILISPLTITAWIATCSLFAVWLYRRRTAYLTATLMLAVFTAFSTMIDNRSQTAGAEIYIPRDRRQTSILIRHNNTLRLATTARSHEIADIIDSYSHRFGLFMMKRGIDSIRPLPENCHSGIFSRQGDLFIFSRISRHESTTIDSISLLLIHGKYNPSDINDPGLDGNIAVSDHFRKINQTPISKTNMPDYAHAGNPGRINYVLVCNGFRDDISELAASVNADTILLSADLNLRRHNRYLRELSAARIPHRTLRQTPFTLKL